MAVFEKTTLGNGIRVVSASMPQVGSVSCFVMLAAGSRYETAESKGIAHFSEHMFFKGTERRPTARTIATEIDAIGGEFNAFTGKELTGYYVKCGSDTRDVAFDVLSDMLLHSRFDPAEIEKEKGVILEEMNVYLDNPQRYIGSVYDRLLYADQPLGWDILGSKETIEAATRETFISYLDAWYKPERIVVGVGGRIGDGLMDHLEELLGGIETRETGTAAPVELPPDRSPVLLHTKQSEQAHLILGVRGYPIGHPDRYALQLLTVVLGGGMSSRLFTEVREKRGLAYYVHAGSSSYTDVGTLYSGAGVDVDRVDEAITTILGELAGDRGRARARRGAREGARLLEGQVRAQAREPAGHDPVRPPPRGARGGDRGAGGALAPDRRRHRRGRPARRARSARGEAALPGGRRAVRRSRAVREADRGVSPA